MSDSMRTLAEDNQIHDYLDEQEFRKHAERNTDYLGNLNDSWSTWVRLSPTGLNVIGEDHTEITLADVVRAVGSRSFIHELFPVDDMSANPATLATFRQMSGDLIDKYGVTQDERLQEYGAESIYPKIGHVAKVITRILKSGDRLPYGDYDGKVYQRYLKIAWAYADDVHASVQSRGAIARAAGMLSARRRAQEQVSRNYASRQPTLGAFMNSLQPGGAIGRSLSDWKEAHPDATELNQELIDFTSSIVKLMQQRVSEARPTLNLFTRTGVTRSRNPDFPAIRNLGLRANVLAAEERGVRYAGMGSDHVRFLRSNLREQNGLHFYDLDGDELTNARSLTLEREDEMYRSAHSIERDDPSAISFSYPGTS